MSNNDNNQEALKETGAGNQGAEQSPKQGGGSIIDNTSDLVSNFWPWKIFFWELFGTAIFAHGICASDGQDWFVTLSLFAGILLVAPFSGGHLNPAVSFGFLIKDGIIPAVGQQAGVWRFKEFFCRCVAQFLGACVGGFTAFTLLSMSAAPNIPSEDWQMLGGYFTGEAFGTFTFVLTILIMTDGRTRLVDEQEKENGQWIEKAPQDSLIVFATIALALHFSRAFTYKTGGGLNPGIAIGLEIWLAIDEGSWEPLLHSWLFVVGPLFGAALAAYYYSYFHLAATNDSGCFHEKTEEEIAQDKLEKEAEASKKKQAETNNNNA